MIFVGDMFDVKFATWFGPIWECVKAYWNEHSHTL